jgi:hypothetical protein
VLHKGVPQNEQIADRKNNKRIAVRKRGLDAFARGLGAPEATDPNDPVLTGGGSLGYNRDNSYTW